MTITIAIGSGAELTMKAGPAAKDTASETRIWRNKPRLSGNATKANGGLDNGTHVLMTTPLPTGRLNALTKKLRPRAIHGRRSTQPAGGLITVAKRVAVAIGDSLMVGF